MKLITERDELAAKLRHMEDTLCVGPLHRIHTDGTVTREINPERLGAVMDARSRAETIIRELRAWLDYRKAHSIEAQRALSELDKLEAR